MGEDRSRCLRNNGYFVILARKLTNSRQGIKSHQRDEFNFYADFAAQQLNTLEARNVPFLNSATISSFNSASYLSALPGVVHPCQIRAIMFRSTSPSMEIHTWPPNK